MPLSSAENHQPVPAPAAEVPSANQTPARGRWTGWLGGTGRGGILAVADQAAVSGTSFLTTVIVGRWCNQDELGLYSLAFTIVMLLAAVQDSLITAPFTVFANRLRELKLARYAGSVLVHQFLLSAATVAALATVAAILAAVAPRLTSPDSAAEAAGLARMSLTLSAVTVLLLLREFGRRFALARMQLATALCLDGAVTLLQLSGLWLVARQGWLTAVTAQVLVGVVCGVVGLSWLVSAHSKFSIERSQISSDWTTNWRYGRWVLFGQLTGYLGGYVMHWLVAAVLGTRVTGVYSACMTVVLLSNPFVIGISNFLGPKMAHAAVTGGPTQVRRIVWQAMLFLGTTLAAFLGAAALYGDQIVQWIYGASYAGYGLTVSVMALDYWMRALSGPADNGLRALHRPAAGWLASASGLGMTLLTAWFLLSSHGVLGAAYALLAGSSTSLLVRMTAFLSVARNSPHITAE